MYVKWKKATLLKKMMLDIHTVEGSTSCYNK